MSCAVRRFASRRSGTMIVIALKGSAAATFVAASADLKDSRKTKTISREVSSSSWDVLKASERVCLWPLNFFRNENVPSGISKTELWLIVF